MLIGYARISTVEQNQRLQVQALQEIGCERIFEETASGTNDNRSGLSAALAYARTGDCIVVWKLDRLARSLRRLIEIVHELEGQEIGFRSLTESIDTTTPGGRLIFHIFGSLAEFERSIIRERTKAGLSAAKRMGRVGGRPKALTDSDIQAAKALLKDPSITALAVANRLSISLSTLYRYIPAAKEGALNGNL